MNLFCNKHTNVRILYGIFSFYIVWKLSLVIAIYLIRGFKLYFYIVTRKIGNVSIKVKLNQKFNPTNLPTKYCFLFCKCLPTLTDWLEPRTLRGEYCRKRSSSSSTATGWWIRRSWQWCQVATGLASIFPIEPQENWTHSQSKRGINSAELFLRQTLRFHSFL